MTLTDTTQRTTATDSSHPLVGQAVECLRQAARRDVPPEDRHVRQPDTWLLRRSWRVLTEEGAGPLALQLAAWLQSRYPMTGYQTLHRLAQLSDDRPELRALVAQELERLRPALFAGPVTDVDALTEGLLWTAASAARIGDEPLAFACLERLDQFRRIWHRVFVRGDWRGLLAESIAWSGLQPLTAQLIRQAVLLFEDQGAHFLQRTAAETSQRLAVQGELPRVRRLLHRCVETFLRSTLTTLTSRRYAVATLALEGLIHDILAQVTTIANIQEARREAGISPRGSEQFLVRQVKRYKANLDVDFQVYTLKEAIETLPPDALTPTGRISLADRLADLGVRSDGWTGAAATAALLQIGGVEQAIRVVHGIDRRDPSRSEGVIRLVRGLLSLGEERLADQEARKGLSWARSLGEHHPERITAWGLAQAYLDHGLPQKALAILDQRRRSGWTRRFRWLFRNGMDEEQVREEALRMRASLLLGQRDRAAQQLGRILRGAPGQMEGKGLALFYADSLLAPLLEAGQDALAWRVLEALPGILARVTGREHPDRVTDVAELVAGHIRGLRRQVAEASEEGEDDPSAEAVRARLEEALAAAEAFLSQLWQAETSGGIWSAVYGVGGSLPLVSAVAGPEAVLEIARATVQEGHRWGVLQPVPTSP